MNSLAVNGTSGQAGLETLGARIRERRERLTVSVRELARRVGVSASLISQIERGRAMPSVGTLYAIANELDLTFDDMFAGWSAGQRRRGNRAFDASGSPIQRSHNRKRIKLSGGVQWERLTPRNDDEVEFLHVVYDPGAVSCPEDSLIRHSGKEYAFILSGRLGLKIGFEDYELGPGDSCSFSSQMPHRLWTIGGEPVHAIWVVVNRADRARTD